MTAVEPRHSVKSYSGLTTSSISDFLAEVETDLAGGVLSPRVFNDPDLHQAELEKIFARCWVFMGHVSEIPSPGDYVLRNIGEDPFILARDEDGEIHALLNHCMHRGAPVCRADKGNASHFRCPYHGWIYKNNGEWNGAPQRTKAYRKLDPSMWGLRKAPHIDTYHGLIFACLDPDAVSLREYLGDMAWYLDTMFDLNDQGMRVAGDPNRWMVPANWKFGAENFLGDAYHVGVVHKSGEEAGMLPPMDYGREMVFHISMEGGHGLLADRGLLPPPFRMGYPPDVADIFDLGRLQPDQREFCEKGFGVDIWTIFPNLSGIRLPIGVDGVPWNINSLRQWQPAGPGKFEMWNWSLLWNAAPDAFNDASYDANIFSFSPSGILEQDDLVLWSGATPAGRSVFARQEMKLNLQMGMDGMSDCEDEVDWMGPGDAVTSIYGEGNARRFYKHWHDMLTRP